MTMNELFLALERRGFRAFLWIPEHDRIQALVRLGSCSMPWTTTLPALNAVTVGDASNFIAREFAEITGKMDFMCCAQCKEPLLRSVGGSGDDLGHDEGSTHWFEYRSAKVGPDSPVLTHCAGCTAQISDSTVQEIKDVEH